jgi:hypothetical protein
MPFDAEILGQVTDPTSTGDGTRRFTQDLNIAPRGTNDAKQYFDQRRFTGSVRSEESEDFARSHFKGDAAKGVDQAFAGDASAIGFTKILDPDEGRLRRGDGN